MVWRPLWPRRSTDMRRWLLGLNAVLLLGVIWGSVWLFGSVGGAAPQEIPVPETSVAAEWEPIEVPYVAARRSRSAADYALVYDNTLFREGRKYVGPDEPTGTAVPSLPEKLPNIGLRGIAKWGTGEPMAYFEIEVVTEKEVGTKKIPTTSREVKPFRIGDEVSGNWRLASVEGMDVSLEKGGVLKRITLGEESEFDNLPKPPARAPTPPQMIRTDAGSVIHRAQPAVPPRPTNRTEASAASPSKQVEQPSRGPVIMTGGAEYSSAAPRPERGDESLLGVEPGRQQLEALEELKKLREYVEKRRAEEGADQPRGR